ncbi:MAG: CPBP family intramembrane metalloprotease [bacterium]|nr:CPBP family intramembrane metalloprotease [bacterium]
MRLITRGLGYGLCSFSVSVAITLILYKFSVIHELPPDIRPLHILYAVIIAPLFEEFIFRFIPIKLTEIFTKRKSILWSVVVLSSILFGVAHGSWYNIFIQGPSGIILSVAFLRGGYFTSVAAHATHNGITLLIINLGF